MSNENNTRLLGEALDEYNEALTKLDDTLIAVGASSAERNKAMKFLIKDLETKIK